LSAEVVAEVIEGITNGCRENGCVLLGGETAEMPGFFINRVNTILPVSSWVSLIAKR
jgi:phosphoribosylaminoimidazole (AIR) synthetase